MEDKISSKSDDDTETIETRQKTGEGSISKNESEKIPTDIDAKERAIAELMKIAKTRGDSIERNKNYQYQLSAYIKESTEKDYFQTLELPLIANENDFAETLRRIDHKKGELEEFRRNMDTKLESLKAEIKKKKEELHFLTNSFTALKEKVALHSVNSENGECFTTKEVAELLEKEEKMRKLLHCYQLEAIKKRHLLDAAIEDKKNSVEGPVDYGEYEIMCTKTENNAEIIKQLNQDIKDFTSKSTKVVNALGHLHQKLHSLKNEKSAALEKETAMEEVLDKMRKDLFKEKTEYSKMSAKNKELKEKCLLLQHPRLLDDYKNVEEENQQAKKELEELKSTYHDLVDGISSE